VVWFLVTDSKLLRHLARDRYGDKVLTIEGLKIEHSSRGGDFDIYHGANLTHDRATEEGFRAAAGENWLLGKFCFPCTDLQRPRKCYPALLTQCAFLQGWRTTMSSPCTVVRPPHSAHVMHTRFHRF
jgi:hypothetical protein